MLTRRHIRIKVMQSVYAFSFAENEKLADEIKFFKKSVSNAFELYVLLLALFKALHRYSEEQIEILNKAQIKVSGQKDKHIKLLENQILGFINDHPTLNKILDKRKIKDWDIEFKYVKRIYQQLLDSSFFEEYLQNEAPTTETDRGLIVKLFREIIAPADYISDYIEDRQLTWQDDFPLVNTFLVKQLKQLKTEEYSSLKFPTLEKNQEELTFGVELLEKVILNSEVLHNEFKDLTPNWDQERIAQLDAILLKMAIAELLYFPTIPPKVTLNEYLEIAKDYSTPKSNSFVNGVLDKIVRQFEKDKRLNKVGRGLK